MTIYIFKIFGAITNRDFPVPGAPTTIMLLFGNDFSHPMPGLHVSTESGYFQGVQGLPFERLHSQNCPILRNHVLFQNEYFCASQDI